MIMSPLNISIQDQKPNLTPSPITLLSLLLVPPLIFLLSKHLFKSSPPLPPGPFRWPILGNLLQIGSNRHVTLARLAETYGRDLFSLKLGTQLVIVGSSPAAAMEILKTHDRSLSGRFIPHVAPSKFLKNNSIAWGDECHEDWKYFRNFSRTELFSRKAMNSQAWIRDQKVKEMVEYVSKNMQGKPAKVKEIAFGAIVNMLGNIIVSKDMGEYIHGTLKGELCELIIKIGDVASSPNISDFYPILGPLDLQNLRKRFMDLFDRSCKQ